MGHPTDQAIQMDPTNKSCEQINHLTQSQSTRVKWDFMRKAGVKFFVVCRALNSIGTGGLGAFDRVQGRSPGKFWHLALSETPGERISGMVIRRH